MTLDYRWIIKKIRICSSVAPWLGEFVPKYPLTFCHFPVISRGYRVDVFGQYMVCIQFIVYRFLGTFNKTVAFGVFSLVFLE
jgi:hypothetical protein